MSRPIDLRRLHCVSGCCSQSTDAKCTHGQQECQQKGSASPALICSALEGVLSRPEVAAHAAVSEWADDMAKMAQQLLRSTGQTNHTESASVPK